MRKYFIVFFFCLSFASESYSQKNFSDYSYIVVPDLYEFLSEKDKYQLNSLTKFLFNKHGFNAYFPDELPNVRRCGGLYADVDLESGFIYTKMSVIIKDCEGTELYRSPQGKSKLKEYKKAYQQSLRKAFENVGRLNVNQKDIVMDDEASGSTSTDTQVEANGQNSSTAKMSKSTNLPQSRFSSYTSEGKSFLLRKTSEGYSLYEESATAEDGLLLVGKLVLIDSQIKFTQESNGNTIDAAFDGNQNLIIGIGYKKVTYKAMN